MGQLSRGWGTGFNRFSPRSGTSSRDDRLGDEEFVAAPVTYPASGRGLYPGYAEYAGATKVIGRQIPIIRPVPRAA